jgi:membrane protein required for colicin V production
VTLFDLIAGLILLVSALVGFVRGGVRETVTIVAFVLAAVGALLALRLSGPLARSAIDPDWLGMALAVLVVFVALYVVIRIAASRLTKKIHQNEALGPIDRTIGVAFGLIRALIVLGVFNLLFNATTPADRAPKWISGAALYPLTSASADVLKRFAPEGGKVAEKLGPAIERAVKEGGETPGEGYDARERGKVDDLVEKAK